MLPEPFEVETNGIRMRVHEAGTGPAVVLLHGFPELPFSWRHQVEPIAAAGFRVIVPALRGYDGSEAPADPLSYSVKNIVADLTGMLDALAVERAVFVGHDWGGVPAWYSSVFAPERVAGAGGICTPYVPPGKGDLVEAYGRAYGPNHYIVAFQEPGVAEALLGGDVEATFRALLRRRGLSLAEFRARPEVREIPLGLLVGEPQVMGEPLVGEDELAVYVEAYRRTGFRGGLSWYRAIHRNWEDAQGRRFEIEVPAIMISAADDFFLPPEQTAGMDALIPDLERHVVADAGHWLQQEKPAEVNALLVAWLQRNFA